MQSSHGAAGSELRRLIESHDWQNSPLGPPDTWAQSFRTIVDFALDSKFPMFLAWGPELACVYNDAYAPLLGNRHPFALGRRFDDVWSDVWDNVKPLVDRALAGEPVYLENLPLTMRRKGCDEVAWFTFTYSPIRDESGAVKGMSCTCMETTQQVQAESKRTREIEWLRDLFEQAPGIMAVVSGPDHVIELVNDAYLNLVGQRVQMGLPARVALPEVAGQGFFELLDQVYVSGEPFVGRAVPIKLQRNQNGTLEERVVDFVYQPIRESRNGTVTGIFIQGSDVTDAVQALQAVRESEERLRQLANTIPQLAWMADPDGNVHWFNDRWYAYTGKTLEQSKGAGWESFVHPNDLAAVKDKWSETLRTGTAYEVTARMLNAHGDYRVFSVRAAPLRNAQGDIVQWFGTNTDVSEIKKAQEDLIAANKHKDEFLAMLAHELRNPLAPINTAAELLKLTGLDQERIRQTSEIITRQVAHMTELVGDLLDVSRVTRGLITLRPELLDLKSIVANGVEQVESLIDTKHQILVTQAPESSLLVMGDRARLTQVVTNLVNNAAKYTPEYGHITIELGRQDDQAEIKVRDSGIGIAPELLPHVFELFTQAERSPDRSQGGLGLGLALVRSLVGLHRGTVTAKSEGVGRGSEFTIRIPGLLQAPPEQAERSHGAERSDSTHGRQILVVDDNVDAAQTLAMLLRTLGHVVAVEHTARGALERARRDSPDVLFLDIGLPEIDGLVLASRLRAQPQTSSSTLIAVTGYGQEEDKARTRNAGFDHHLVKPVRLETILDVLVRSA